MHREHQPRGKQRTKFAGLKRMRLGSGLASIWHLARCDARPPVSQLCCLEALDGWRAAKQVLEDERQVVSVACRRGFGGGVGSQRMTHSEKKMLGYGDDNSV